MSIEDEQIKSQQHQADSQDLNEQLGTQARIEFEKKNYEACLKCIEKMIDCGQNSSTNVKLLANKAICEYALGNFKNAKDFKIKLVKICNQIKINFDDKETLESSEYCILFYNYAVLLSNLKLYNKSLSLVEKILDFVESLDDYFMRKITFLIEHNLLIKPEIALNTILNYEKQCSNRQENENDELILSKFKIKCNLQMKNYLNDKDLYGLLGSVNLNDSAFILLQANNEYLANNYQKSLELLVKSSQDVFTYNNMGCIHFNTKKYGLSLLYYRRALSENHNGASQYELIFNLGVGLLYNKQPLLAFDCFIDVINHYRSNSRLWLRVAECCVQALRAQNDEMCRISERIKCVQKSIGINIYHKLIFAPRLSSSSQTQTSSQATLEFAYMCLRNAFILLPHFDTQQDPNTKLFNNFQPSTAITLVEVKKLKCSILVALSFVSLSLNDYSNTIKYCNVLLSDCDGFLSKGNRYLTIQYLAEALYYSDRVNDSIEKLIHAFMIEDLNLSFGLKGSSNKYDTHNWYPRDNDTALAILNYNLAVAQATRGDIEASYKSFDQCVKLFGNQHPVNVYHMKIYLNLLDGKRAGLQTFLRDYFGHATINRSYQPYNPIKTIPLVPHSQQQTPPVNLPTSLSNVLLQQQQQQQQQLPTNLLQQQAQLMQLAQQQQYLNQINLLASPLGFNNMPAAFSQQQQQSPSASTTSTQSPFTINQPFK